MTAPGDAIRPPRLAPGMTIGIVSPCSPSGPARVATTVRHWEERGYRVRLGEHVSAELGGYLAGSAQQRAADLNAMLRADDVDAIVPTMGGKGASQLLPLLDYEALRARPRVVLGLSDSSILVLALHAGSGVVTFHGPTGMDYDALPGYSERAMHAMLETADAPPPLEPFSAWRTLRGGAPVQGRLLGGHLGTIRALLGTPYAPDWRGAILFVEEIDAEYHDVDAALTHFRLAGVLDEIAGLVVGRPVNVEERWRRSDETLDDVVLRCCEGLGFPIVAGVDVGHAPEKLTLPVGAVATLDPERAALALDEPAVAPA